MTSDATIVTGRRVAERYRLVESRGNGSWSAVDERLRRNVVVHLLRADAAAPAKAHFTAEARCLARLNHRNIVATYDTGVDGDGTSYRVDELAGGEPLDLHAVATPRRVSYAKQLARAVNDAHAEGLVHGTLTSSDVLANDEGRVQVRGLRLPAPDEDADALKRSDVLAVVGVVVGLAPASASALREAAVALRAATPASMGDVCRALDSVPDDVELDDASAGPLTPPAGVPIPRRGGRRLLLLGVVVVVAVAIVVTVVLPSQRDREVSGPTRPLSVTARSFDPEASPPTENETQARLAVDGNASTVWFTERYHSAHFGNLKKGVGLVLVSAELAEFDQLVITSATRGWDVQIYVAEGQPAALAGWGDVRAGGKVSGPATFDLKGAPGTAVLVWITDPGPTRQVRIGEITVQGRVTQPVGGADDANLAAALDGDQRALDQLLRANYARLYAVCRRLTGNDPDAADACQDALIAIVRNLGKFDRRSRFSTWSYRIAVNASLDELRRRRRRPEPTDVQLETARLPASADPSASVVDRLTLDAALATLSPEFRSAVVLRDVAGLDYAEIAAALEIPPGTVRSRIARGRAALADVLGEPSHGARFV